MARIMKKIDKLSVNNDKCSDKSFAPNLTGFQNLSGFQNLFLVITDFVEGEDTGSPF
jgi:hypothetical protein